MSLFESPLKSFKKLAWKTSIFWLSTSLIVWIFGIGGRDLYALPGLIGLILLFRELILKDNSISIFDYTESSRLLVLGLYSALVLIVLTATFLNLYSFRWNIFDVGSYSSVVFNLSHGLNYNSFLQIPATADHFTPSLAIFTPLYQLVPSVHWLTLTKALSYLSVPLIVYFWLKDKTEKNFRFTLSIGFGLWMLLFYKPAVSSRLFEFSPSSLALPFIIYSFILMERKRWILFTVTMLFLLGLKEHMGIVLIGFGLFEIAKKNFKTGVIFFGLGLLIVYAMIFQFMPYFRDYQVFGNTQIAPFQDFYGKSLYLLKLLWPLGFLPVIFWRYGILAAPAIGVNLISGRPGMYSSEFHYDDVSSILLLMACTLILLEKRQYLFKLFQGKRLKGVFIIWLFCIMLLLPPSPAWKLADAIPQEIHLSLRQEIRTIERKWPEHSLAVQSTIGPHFQRNAITIIGQQSSGVCLPPLINGVQAELILLSPDITHYMIDNFDNCIQSLEKNPNYIRLKTFQNLMVYKRRIN